MATDTSELLYEVKDRIATITLNRPDKMNAFTGPMIERWAASLQEAQRDPSVNVVVVTGAGRAFCSGGDVGRMGSGDPTPLEFLTRTVDALTVTIGGVPAAVSFSGLTPGSTALYQANVTVPSGVANGDAVPVVLTISGQDSVASAMAVRN